MSCRLRDVDRAADCRLGAQPKCGLDASLGDQGLETKTLNPRPYRIPAMPSHGSQWQARYSLMQASGDPMAS